MHSTIENLINIENKIKLNLKEIERPNKPKIIAVSKTFPMDKILPLINHGHIDFGENKVQEAVNKWTDIKIKNPNIRLHMIGKLQTNKVKFAIKLFDFIHSVDSSKLAKKIADEQKKIDKDIKVFLQVNIGNESQKSGISKFELNDLILYCRDLNLSLMGLMCIPPEDNNRSFYFKEMNNLNNQFRFSELSMGMSSDYLQAVKNNSTYVRIGSNIFGQRS